jgi:hypothetical protein
MVDTAAIDRVEDGRQRAIRDIGSTWFPGLGPSRASSAPRPWLQVIVIRRVFCLNKKQALYET